MALKYDWQNSLLNSRAKFPFKSTVKCPVVKCPAVKIPPKSTVECPAVKCPATKIPPKSATKCPVVKIPIDKKSCLEMFVVKIPV